MSEFDVEDSLLDCVQCQNPVKVGNTGRVVDNNGDFSPLCSDCYAERCCECDTVMIQSRPEWQWHCPGCGITYPPELMEFFKGNVLISFPEQEKK